MRQHITAKTGLLKLTLYTVIVSFTTAKSLPKNHECSKTNITRSLLDVFTSQVELTEKTYCYLVNQTYPCDHDNACPTGSDYKPRQYRKLNLEDRLSKNYAHLNIFEQSLTNMKKRRINSKFAEKFQDLWQGIKNAQLKILQCLETCFKNANENNDHALGHQLFMQFSLDQTVQPLCKGSPSDQEIAVLKHLRIVYTQIIMDLVLRLKTASIDNDTVYQPSGGGEVKVNKPKIW